MAQEVQYIEDAIYTLLNADAPLALLVGENIFNGQAPQDDATPIVSPYVIFNLLMPKTESTFTTDVINAELQIDVYQSRILGTKAARLIEEAVYAALNRVSVTPTNWNYAKFESLDRGHPEEDQDDYRIISIYRVYAR